MNEGQILIDDGDYFIQWNVNYTPMEDGNAFLCKRDFYKGSGWTCVGGIECNGVDWKVDITSHYDEESGSDVDVIGFYDKSEEAIAKLWDSRAIAFS